MTKFCDLINQDKKESIAKSSIKKGNVFRIRMDKSNGITPKQGDEYRFKFFIVLGFDENGYVYGGVVFNSNINLNLQPEIRLLHMPIDYTKYSFLEHKSFVDCSRLKKADPNNLLSGDYVGCIDDYDLTMITETVCNSPVVNMIELMRFGLIA